MPLQENREVHLRGWAWGRERGEQLFPFSFLLSSGWDFTNSKPVLLEGKKELPNILHVYDVTE